MTPLSSPRRFILFMLKSGSHKLNPINAIILARFLFFITSLSVNTFEIAKHFNDCRNTDTKATAPKQYQSLKSLSLSLSLSMRPSPTHSYTLVNKDTVINEFSHTFGTFLCEEDKVKTSTNKVKTTTNLRQGKNYYKQGKKCRISKQGILYYKQEGKKCHTHLTRYISPSFTKKNRFSFLEKKNLFFGNDDDDGDFATS